MIDTNFDKILKGYQVFRDKYVHGDTSIMQHLSRHGQQPETMVIACCDSRVDPALILQCDPGDLFVVRNVANIVPPYEKDGAHHGTSAALEFAVCFLKVKHIVLLGHSQCGGIQALLDNQSTMKNDFINNWVSLIKSDKTDYKADLKDADDYAKFSLKQSEKNCLSFPWIKSKVSDGSLTIHLWFFDIKTGQIYTYFPAEDSYRPLEAS